MAIRPHGSRMGGPRSFRHRTLPALGIVGLFLLAILSPPATAVTTRTLEISNATANETNFMRAFDAPAVAMADFDGDGHVELVAHNDNQYLYVLSTKEARVLAEIRPPYPPGWGARPLNSPVVRDVDLDGRLDIVVTNSAAVTCVYEYNPGTSTAASFKFDQVWCHRADRYDGGTAASDSAPWVEDVTGDGLAEIFQNTEEVGYFAYNHDGAVRWSRPLSGGNAGPVVSDLDGDGRKEVLFFGDAGEVRTLDAATGNTKWNFFANAYVWPASLPVAGQAGDLDGDGRKEVVFVARDARDSSNYHNNHFMLFVLNHDGSLRWRAQPAWGNPMSYTHPILHDLTGDGRKEILLQDWNTIGHKPGAWERLGPANVFAYRADGSLLWRTQLENTWSNDDLGLADFDGDGNLEVLAIGWSGPSDALWYLDARTGAKEQTISVPGWTVLRGPVVGDFDGTGDLDWAIPLHTTSKGGAFHVFDTDAPCRVVYGGWQNLNPCSPLRGAGGGGGGTTSYTATVQLERNTVAQGETLSGVLTLKNTGTTPVSFSDATIAARPPGGTRAGGPYMDFSKTGPVTLAPGETRQFTLSRAFTTSDPTGTWFAYGTVRHASGNWEDLTPNHNFEVTAAGGGGGGGSTFSATYRTNGGNDWWVEVYVDANQALAGVDARVNGGAWVPLEKRSWGSWAKSFHVPAGSTVEFRARATSGETHQSCGYTWPQGTPTGTCGGGGGTPPPPTGFTATFKNARGNTWWVEVDVSANEPLAGVDARVNGGAWVPLEKRSWGSWAKSFHVPAGSTVEFRARSTSGATALSGTYTWPPS